VTRGPEQRLDDIEDAITRIRAAMAALDSGIPDPQADLARDAVLYRLLVIGEAAKARCIHRRKSAVPFPP
jgi:uncharacterized protein with HEPN domain